MSIRSILASAVQKSDWADWLVTSSAASAVETCAFVDRSLSNLPPSTLNRVARRLQRSDPAGIDAVIHELVAFEVCRTFHLSPTFEPDAGGQTPDLSILVGDKTFWCDVFVTYRPTQTLTTFEGATGYEDGGQAAKKIADTLSAKAVKYRKLDGPLLVFVMFGSYSVDLHDLESALYGSSVEEIAAEGVSTSQCHEDWHRHGILCPPSSDESHHPWLSAVVGCDWFDTLNRAARGRRLHCVIYHHWRPQLVLPLGVFAPFCDLSWRVDTAHQRVMPQLRGDANIVMNTTSSPPTFAPYSSEQPW